MGSWANPTVLTKWRESDDMCQALLEVMKPEIDKIREEEKKNGIEIGEKRGKIIGLIEAFRELDRGDKEIKQILVQKYKMTEEEALSYL